MTYLRLLLLVVIWPMCIMPVHAQLFRKKPAAPAPQRVPELVIILKTDPEERKRESAAEELRDFDARTYTEIVPVLVDAARNDAKVGVRLEAITSLGKLRPISQEAGHALERAAADDANLRVRMHARTTLWKYQLAGYSSGGATADAKKKKSTEEPPILEPAVLLPPKDMKPGAAKGDATTATPKIDPPRPPSGPPAFSTAVPQRPKLVTRPAHGPTIVEEEITPLPPLPASTVVTPPRPSAPTVVTPPLPVLPPLPEGPPLPR